MVQGCDLLELSSFSFIFLGDTHGYWNDFSKQKEIIDAVRPEIVLCEQLQNKKLDTKRDYQEILLSKFISDTVEFEQMEKLITLCHKRKISLIGIDRYNYSFSAQILNALKTNTVTQQQSEEMEALAFQREKEQAKSLKKYVGFSSKPILVIVGTWHLRDNSPLFQGLLNYAVIFPVDENNKPLYGPKSTQEKYGVKYVE